MRRPLETGLSEMAPSAGNEVFLTGALDLANALRHVDVVSGFGSVWYIPTMLVPLLLVTHVMMFMRLVRGAGEGGWYERAR